MNNISMERVEAEKPMGHATALRYARVLMGSYPREPHDPETFIVGMTQLLAEHTESVAKAAIDHLTRTLKHQPTRADMAEALDLEIKSRRPRLVTRAGIQCLTLNAELDSRREAKRKDREQLEATLGPASADWWSIPVIRRFAGGTAAQFRDAWFKTENNQAARDHLLMTWGGDAA